MNFTYRRTYTGSVKLAVFDWAGTTIDYGCCAPAAAFIEGFKRKGVAITMAQARAPMGLEKRDHIKAITDMESVAMAWEAAHGHYVTAQDIDDMYHAFVPVLLEVLTDYAKIIPGTLETVKQLHQMGIKIGGTTGYFEEALAICQESAAKQGYEPDFVIGATQVPNGRPAPWMIYETMKNLNIYPVEAVVKVGDTVPDIEAALNAGAWAIGVAQTGNEVGLTEEEWSALNERKKMQMMDTAVKTLSQAGAHYVVDTIADVPAVIEDINIRLNSGERPS